MQIPSSEVRFHDLSFGDPNGRVFWWREELYRGITREKAGFYQKLSRDKVLDALVSQKLLVDTVMTDLSLGDYTLVFHHRTIPFVSYASEWCGPMLKDAALHLLSLEHRLINQGLTLQDAHPWNLLFDGPQPRFVDLGSIVSLGDDSTWPAADEFRRFFLNPLVLMASGFDRIARSLLQDFDRGVEHVEASALYESMKILRPSAIRATVKKAARGSVPVRIQWHLDQARRKRRSSGLNGVSPQKSLIKCVESLQDEVSSIKLPSKRTEWSNYYDESFPSFDPDPQWTPKHTSMSRIFDETRPSTLLDIGSNRGWFSQQAARKGTRVVAADVDEPAVAKLYGDAKSCSSPILPLILDFRNPTPGRGVCNQWFPPAIERFQADMVVALALVHHLVPKQGLRFNHIVSGLSAFAKRWLVVEFIPREDKYVREWWTEKFAWYSLDNFLSELRTTYRSISQFPSNLEHRRILLCER